MRHRGDAPPRRKEAKHHCLPAASRFCNGTEPIQPEDSHAFDGKRGRMPAEFFKAEVLLICRTDALKNQGNQKESAAGKSGDFCFSGAGVKGNAMPIVRGAGGETFGAGQGRQTLVWVQGRRALLRVEGGEPRPVGLLFTAALTGYYLPKMSHKNPGFTRQGHLKKQQNRKKGNHGFRKNAENSVKRKTENLQKTR